MRRQRNVSQMKQKNKTPEKELNKMETSNLLDTEFKTLVTRMLSDLSENFNKELENIKRNKSEMNIPQPSSLVV